MAAPEGYKTLGKIGISYKGDYNANTAYERLDAVLHNGSTYLAIKDAPDELRGMIRSTGSIWPRALAATSGTRKSRLLRRRTARTLIRARA